MPTRSTLFTLLILSNLAWFWRHSQTEAQLQRERNTVRLYESLGRAA